LGVQSLNDALLKKLGRAHSSAEALKAAELCLREIPNVSGDLLYAVPGQDPEEPGLHAQELVGLGLRHLSAYHLTLGPEHFLHPKLPPDSVAWSQIRGISERLLPFDFLHYEVASFAKPGSESRNNKNYWSGGPYLALGPSAHGFDGDFTRWNNIADWREYIRRIGAGESPIAETEQLSLEQRRIEVIFTSLRTAQGLDLAAFQGRFGEDLEATRGKMLARWAEEGLGWVTNGRLVLTFSGRMLADEIAKALL
jgi:oxygen-independent coproporphyrinogen-3 oxidase